MVAAVATVLCLVLLGSFLSSFTIIVFGPIVKNTQPHTNLSYPKEPFLNDVYTGCGNGLRGHFKCKGNKGGCIILDL